MNTMIAWTRKRAVVGQSLTVASVLVGRVEDITVVTRAAVAAWRVGAGVVAVVQKWNTLVNICQQYNKDNNSNSKPLEQ